MVKKRFKRLLKSHPRLFRIWYHLYRKNRGNRINFFDSNTKYLLDGYPRSGNTFAFRLTKTFFGSNNCVQHLHASAAIKIALKLKLPAFVLVRNPDDAISSYYLKTFYMQGEEIPKTVNKELLLELTGHYIDYYQYVFKVIDKVEIISFDELVQKPAHLVDKINSIVFKNSFVISESDIEKAVAHYRGALDGTDKPSSEKELQKNILKNELNSLAKYHTAEEIFHRIATKKNNYKNG